MNTPIISIIAAMSENRVIGNKGEIPWHIPEDFKRFKSLTMGHPIIMGRKTFESIGKLLPGRTNIVVSHNPSLIIEGCLPTISLDEAIQKASSIDQHEIFVIGGGQIYKEAILFANKLYVTIVKGEFEGDAFFPDYSRFKIDSQKDSRDENFEYSFLELTPK